MVETREREEEMFMSPIDMREIERLLPDMRTLRDIARFYAIFSDECRVRIISALAISEMCVTDLAILTRSHQSTVSHQLKILRDEGIVDYRREGKMIVYYVTSVLIDDVMGLGIENIRNNMRRR